MTENTLHESAKGLHTLVRWKNSNSEQLPPLPHYLKEFGRQKASRA